MQQIPVLSVLTDGLLPGFLRSSWSSGSAHPDVSALATPSVSSLDVTEPSQSVPLQKGVNGQDLQLVPYLAIPDVLMGFHIVDPPGHRSIVPLYPGEGRLGHCPGLAAV